MVGDDGKNNATVDKSCYIKNMNSLIYNLSDIKITLEPDSI